MASDRPDYLIGEKGVNLVASPLHTPDGGLLAAQNVEFVRVFGIGGIGSRGGLAPLNTSALAGAVLAAVNVPLAVPGATTLMLATDTGQTETWRSSTDGAAFTNILTAVCVRMASMAKFPAGVTPLTIPPTQRIASVSGKLYFSGDDYVISAGATPWATNTAPPIIMWNGVSSVEQVRLPPNAAATGPCRWVTDFWVNAGVIYIAVWDQDGVAPNQNGRVLSYNPVTGAIGQLGTPFGGGASQHAGGMPFCLTSFAGLMWAGTYGVLAGADVGKVYRINPLTQVEWKLDHSVAATSGYVTSLCVYAGALYVATNANNGGASTAVIEKRTAAGVWSTSFSAPDTNTSYCSSMIVFGANLYAAYFKSGVRVLVKKFDGTSWTTEKDVGVDFGSLVVAPGMPFLFGADLYWPFTAQTAGGTTGYLAKRTAAGVWSQVLTATSLRGLLGTFEAP